MHRAILNILIHDRYSSVFWYTVHSVLSITSITSIYLTNLLRTRVYLLESLCKIYLLFSQNNDSYLLCEFRIFHLRIRFSFLIIFVLHLFISRRAINNAEFSMLVRATSTESNQSKMRLIRSNQENTRELSFTQAWIENQEQTQTESEEVIETTKKSSSDQKTSREIYVQTLQTFDQSWQQHQTSRAYSHSTCKEVEIDVCSAICWIRCFICFRIEIFYVFSIDHLVIFFVISIDNFLISHVIESFISLDFYIRNCTRAFRKRIIYFFKTFIRIFVDCNIKKIDILNRNCITLSRCIEVLSSFDCDIQIDVQIVEKCKHCLFAYFIVYFVSNIYIIEILSHRERSVSHVRWEIEFIWFAATSNAFVFFSRLWQMQFRKQMWFHTKSHYVIFSCDDHTCFQIDQIRSICINSCSRNRFASVFDLRLIYLFFFSIFYDLSFVFCLQTLSKTFRHVLICRLSHIKCHKSWKRWNIHENAFFTFRSSLSLYFERVLISLRENHYFEKINMLLFVVLLVHSSCWSLIDLKKN